jgi:hypothetical protein
VTRKHAVIAGSGRSGTTFLIEFLAVCGVPTHPIDQLGYFAEARAGREQSLLDPDAGYLVKDPWVFDYVDEINLDEITIEAIIIPVRDLRAAATSRVIQERSYRYSRGTLDRFRTMFGDTPAGVLNPIDVAEQEKHLAVSQSRLFSWCLGNDLPVFMLQYPRLITDGDYLVSVLWPWLQTFTTRNNALSVFKDLAMPNLSIDDLASSDHGDVEKENLRIEVEALSRALDTLRKQSQNTIQELQQQTSALSKHLADTGKEQLRHAQEVEHLSTLLSEARLHLAAKDRKIQRISARVEKLDGALRDMKASETWRAGRILLGPVHLFRKIQKS